MIVAFTTEAARPMPRRRVLRLFALATVGTWLQSSGSLARAGLGRTQHVCDTRVATIYAGTNEIMKEIIGRGLGL